MEVEKHSIEIALGKFLSRHSHGVRDAGNPVTSLSDHFLNHLRNQGLVFDDKDAWKVGSHRWRARVGHGKLSRD
jgi:hypothetical protein